MRKLLSVECNRLLRSKVFWTLELLVFVGEGIFIYLLVGYNTRNLGEAWLLHNANSYFFFEMMYMGAVIAILTSLFVGTEYSDGTIRNKIVVGCRRREIYLAECIVMMMGGLVFMVTHMLIAVLVGIPVAGFAVITAITELGWRLLCCCCAIVCYAAIFVPLALLDSNKARNAVLSLLLALVFILLGMYVYGSLQEPEFVSRMVMQEDGSFLLQEGLPNSRYLSGTARTIFTWLDRILPSGQAMHIFHRDGSFDLWMPICSAVVALAVTAFGISLFQKKDIK